MTLALELASHGVRSIVLERNQTTTRHPKMDLTNGRSMELFRRLGMSDRLRTAGVPEDHAFDIVWASGGPGVGRELHRFRYPSAHEAREIARCENDGTYTCEPGMRVSQIVIEPVLKAAIEASPLVDIRFGWAFESLEQDSDGVMVTVVNRERGARQVLRGEYLAGCDGGGSRVRSNLGIELEGQLNVGRSLMIHVRSERRDLLQPEGPWWHWQTPGGSMIAQNDRDTWTVHAPVPPGADEAALDPAAILRDWAGRDFEFEILVSNAWSPHLVMATRFSEGRVFLAGDSIHQVIPTGGYGMNTGVGDAVDLGWKLAATINGWGGPRLLESYEAERRPIATQNRAASKRHMDVRIQIAQVLMSGLSAATANYAEIGRAIAHLGNRKNEYWGIEYGYRYHGSPVIAAEPDEPPFDPARYIATTWPGARLPHVFLPDGTALYDHLGPDFTLIAFDGADSGPVEQAARECGLPLRAFRAPLSGLREIYERRLLLVRPDHHVAWRGDDPPNDSVALFRRLSGWLA